MNFRLNALSLCTTLSISVFSTTVAAQSRDVSLPQNEKTDDTLAISDCDTLAGVNVPLIEINAAKAVKACQTALNEEGANAKIRFNLGRAYLSVGDEKNVLKAFRYAARNGHVGAMFELGRFYNKKEELEKAASWYERAARAGDRRAMAWMGFSYGVGRGGLSIDPKLSLEWYKKSAASGSALAMNNLASAYLEQQNLEEASYWLIKSADNGFVPAMRILARYLQDGLHGHSKKPQQARKWMLEAASQGDVIAMNDVGYYYKTGFGGITDLTKSREWFERAAAGSNPNAFYNLAEMHRLGEGTPKNFAKAKQYYRKAADQGLVPAMYRLGLLHRDGLGTRKSGPAAVYWLQKAADSDHTLAMFSLGLIYDLGLLAPENKAVARKWYSRAAAKGSPNAKHNLALMFHSGEGVQKDRKRSQELFVQAAQTGLVPSMYEAGRSFYFGWGGGGLRSASKQWFEKAAAQGHKGSMFFLGNLYETGFSRREGGALTNKPDISKALFWYERSANGKHPQGVKAFNRLSSEIEAKKQRTAENRRRTEALLADARTRRRAEARERQASQSNRSSSRAGSHSRKVKTWFGFSLGDNVVDAERTLKNWISKNDLGDGFFFKSRNTSQADQIQWRRQYIHHMLPLQSKTKSKSRWKAVLLSSEWSRRRGLAKR